MQRTKALARTLGVALTGAAISASISIAAEDPQPKSVSILEFAGANTLFAADSVGGRIFAFELDGIPNVSDATDSAAYNVLGLGRRLARSLGVSAFDITYHDLAVHPVTHHAFVSLSVADADGPRPAIAKIDHAGGVVVLDLARLDGTSLALTDAPEDGVTFWRDIPAATLTVTDLAYTDGELFVAGISTGEFASTLRRIPFPFNATFQTASVEMYHTAHNQNETRAPIRAMSIARIDGRPTVIAAYTCTPLVTIPVADLEDGAHVTGKTIAELGYGNTPLEVLSFAAMNMEQERENYVLVINREMDADLIRLADVEAAEAVTTPAPYLGATVGVATVSLPLSGVLQAADQDAQFLLTLKRNLDTGDMDLVSYRKGAYMRLSDFISEYNFPDYAYIKEQEGTRRFQNLLKMDEGYKDLVR